MNHALLPHNKGGRDGTTHTGHLAKIRPQQFRSRPRLGLNSSAHEHAQLLQCKSRFILSSKPKYFFYFCEWEVQILCNIYVLYFSLILSKDNYVANANKSNLIVIPSLQYSRSHCKYIKKMKINIYYTYYVPYITLCLTSPNQCRYLPWSWAA